MIINEAIYKSQQTLRQNNSYQIQVHDFWVQNQEDIQKLNNIFPNQMNDPKKQRLNDENRESSPSNQLIAAYIDSDMEDSAQSLEPSLSEIFSSDEQSGAEWEKIVVQMDNLDDSSSTFYESMHLDPQKEIQGMCELIRDRNEELKEYKDAFAASIQQIKRLKQENSKLKFQNWCLKEEITEQKFEVSLLREKLGQEGEEKRGIANKYFGYIQDFLNLPQQKGKKLKQEMFREEIQRKREFLQPIDESISQILKALSVQYKNKEKIIHEQMSLKEKSIENQLQKEKDLEIEEIWFLDQKNHKEIDKKLKIEETEIHEKRKSSTLNRFWNLW